MTLAEVGKSIGDFEVMEQFISFGIVGLSTAAIYAIIGSGLVVTYTTTGVFNFAHGATGMMAAFSYWQLSVGWGCRCGCW